MPEKATTQTILIIDDSPTIRDLLSSVLMSMANIELAVDGVTGLEAAKKIKPDLIILDVQMPGIDGYDVCRQLKDNDETAETPVVFVTAQEDDEEEEKGLSIGATDYIRKPFTFGIVLARVKNILKMQEMKKELERLAYTDPLTSAFNRRYFLSAAKKEILRSSRYGHSLTLLMVDIDHFKSVNDTYGHDIGDEALKITVTTILKALRSEDILGRFGGEEFIILLPETNAVGAELVAQRIRQVVSEIIINTGQKAVSFTVSVGVAEIKKNETIEEMQKRADEALYKAKENGRNCVVTDS
jgi:diguanylate cyclase (GGDEF)-like protein